MMFRRDSTVLPFDVRYGLLSNHGATVTEQWANVRRRRCLPSTPRLAAMGLLLGVTLTLQIPVHIPHHVGALPYRLQGVTRGLLPLHALACTFGIVATLPERPASNDAGEEQCEDASGLHESVPDLSYDARDRNNCVAHDWRAPEHKGVMDRCLRSFRSCISERAPSSPPRARRKPPAARARRRARPRQ